MRKDEVYRIIGDKWRDNFLDFMVGQGVGVYPDGETDFFEEDVRRFCRLRGIDFEERKGVAYGKEKRKEGRKAGTGKKE